MYISWDYFRVSHLFDDVWSGWSGGDVTGPVILTLGWEWERWSDPQQDLRERVIWELLICAHDDDDDDGDAV